MTTRRGFLSAMLAAAAAPAYVKAGVLMPVKKIITPPWGLQPDGSLIVHGVDDVMYSAPMMMNGGMLWQDMARTIPVTRPGQPVAVVDHLLQSGGQWHAGVQPTMARRPVFELSESGPCVRLDGVDDTLLLPTVSQPLYVGRRSNFHNL